MSVPDEMLKCLVGHGDENKKLALFKCKECGTIPHHYTSDIQINNSNFISLNCTSSECPRGTWYICCVCHRSFARHGKAEKHTTSAVHVKKVEAANKELKDQALMVATPASVNSTQSSKFEAAFGKSNFHPVFGDSQQDSLYYPCSLTFDNNLDDDGEDTGSNTDVTGMDTINQEVARVANQEESSVAQQEPPKDKSNSIPLDVQHGWLAELLKDTPKASGSELHNSLKCSPNMQRFWQAEHEAPGGGLVFMVGRAFHRKTFLGSGNLPDLEEAKWHFQNFILYVGMSEKQRHRHAQVTMEITRHGSSLIQKTRIPNAQELKRFYKSDCQHCLWQSLPVPVIHNIRGIAYVNPVDIVRFAFACGLNFDDITVSSKDSPTGNFSGKQYHVADCKRLRDLIRTLREAQDEDGNYDIVVAWATDWRDGFSANRTKQNRKSVVAWTFTVSPPKDTVNDVQNTFCMALGQKKNSAWPEVEHRVREDTSSFGDPNKPLRVYHGRLRKMVSVFINRINTSHDKPERADVTGTISYSSNIHRSFGRLVQLVTPHCDPKKIKPYLEQAKPNKSNELANALEWGWSDRMLDADEANRNANGGVLPACQFCRGKRLLILLGSLPGVNRGVNSDDIERNYGRCPICADWTMDSSTASKLPFKAPKDYPTTHAPNCPVEPPPGRCTTSASLQRRLCPESGKEENFLKLAELEFPNLVKATKFTFFNLVSQNPWTERKASAYLNANGIAPKFHRDLFDSAKDAVNSGRAAQVDYSDPERIDNFRFPAAWIDSHLGVSDYIETVMHELCLGVAESNFELCSEWNKARSRDTAFRRNAQELLQELKRFGLNWLHTYPFSAGDDGKKSGTYGTGAWQGENWIAWIRIQKVLYLHAATPLTKNNHQTTGNGDIFRLVIVFAAFAARALSHSGVDDSDIQDFNHYLKEFLSCVRELDIQTRYDKMKKKTRRALDPEEDSTHAAPIAPTGKEDGNIDANGASLASTGKDDGNTRVNCNIQGANPLTNQKQGTATNVAGEKNTTRKRSGVSSRSSSLSTRRKKTKVRKDDSDEEYVEESNNNSSGGQRTKNKKGNRKRQASVTADGSTANPKKKQSKKQAKKPAPKYEVTGGSEAWWTKSNYLSLPNLVRMLEMFGQLINFWDGGGKGEKFVQEVKPLICRGVHDYASFFVVIMDKLYKYRFLDIVRELYGLFGADNNQNIEEKEHSRFFIDPDGEIYSNIPDEFPPVPDEMNSEAQVGQDYSPMEDRHMYKLKTFYCYRTKQQLDDALEDGKPISGILVHDNEMGNCTKLEFYVLYIQKKTYCWKKIIFDDSQGVLRGGLWYAPMLQTDPCLEIKNDFSWIQGMAKMSTVAIPMYYGIGTDHPDSSKFCVITNWWKERGPDGRYTKPGLDSSYYVKADNYADILARLEDETGAVI